MTTSRLVRLGLASAALCLVAAICNAGVAAGALRHTIVYYAKAPNAAVRQLVAERYDMGLTGDPGTDAVDIKALNPDFQWFTYNSATDNYVTGAEDQEHTALAALAASRGFDLEDCYLHYWDDTQVTLEGQVVTIPGWGGGSATDPAQARIPVYYKNLSRRLVNFSTPAARQIQKEFMIGFSLDRTFSGTNLYPDGLFLDNCSAVLFNQGDVQSGGHVREAPGHPRVDSPEFQDWFWNQNLGLFLSELKDTLETSAGWAPDGRRKRLMINAANVWDDSYVSLDVADVLCLENQYSPVKNFGLGEVDEAYRRDRLAADHGIESFYLSMVTTQAGSYPGVFNYDQALMGSLAWFLTTRTAQTSLFLEGTFDPRATGWDTLTWRGAVDVADNTLGDAVGDPFTLASGVDPLGQEFVVKARRYTNGLAVVRPRGEWNQGIAPATAVTVELPSLLAPVSPAGDVGSPVSTVTLRNGQGALFVGDPGTGGGGGGGGGPDQSDLVTPPSQRRFAVVTASPRPGDGAVPPGAAVTFTLNDAVDPASLSPQTVRVTGTTSGAVNGGVWLEHGGTRVVFNHAAAFAPGETITAVLSGTLQDVAGFGLDGNDDGLVTGDAADDYRLTFTVASTP
jgi:hypothetical protein